MKTYTYLIIALATISMVFSSCSKDDEDKTAPEVSGLEIGHDNSKQFHQGGDVHLEFEVADNEGLDYYTVTIHHKAKSTVSQWDYENTWMFQGNPKNDLVHQHEIIVPEDADPGVYDFKISITDINGNTTTIDESVEVLEAVQGDGPDIHVESHPDNGELFSNGELISIAGHVHSDNSHIAGIFIGIMKAADNLADEDVNESNAIVLYHQHDFEMQEVEFDASITVGAEVDNNQPDPNNISTWEIGAAYILVKASDEEGRISFSEHIPIQINN